MKIQRVRVAKDQYIWLVLDDDFLPIKPIEAFIRYLHHTEKSPDTIQGYASHLKLFWDYLTDSQKNWQTVSIADFAEFVHWLRSHAPNVIHLKDNADIRRTERTVNTILNLLKGSSSRILGTSIFIDSAFGFLRGVPPVEFGIYVC